MLIQQLLEESANFTLRREDRRVLVVDDEEVVLRLLASILATAGMTVELCPTGEMALELLARGSFRVAVVDKNLPDQSGLDLIRKAKVQLPQVEFVLMTAYGEIETVVKAMDAGATGYLSKPFDNRAVITRVETALKRSEAHARNDFLLERMKTMFGAAYEAQMEVAAGSERHVRDMKGLADSARAAMDDEVRSLDGALVRARELAEAAKAFGGLLARVPNAPSAAPLETLARQLVAELEVAKEQVRQGQDQLETPSGRPTP